jgi:acyl-CoA reductase-like NAD-dependent aldehyde dehydrogenase
MSVAPKGSATPRDEIDRVIARLSSRKDAWVALSADERANLLERCIPHTLAVAEEWVDAACQAKGIDRKSSRAGEEYLGGPMTTIRNLRLYVDALRAGGEPAIPEITERPDGQKVCKVFPGSTMDSLMWTGFSAEVWVEPGQPATQGALYRAKRKGTASKTGNIGVVLGAGNVASIGPMDALYKLIVDDEVALVKTNPVNAYLQHFWEEAFRPLLNEGFFAVVRGGADVGAYLCNHPEVHSIHITGSDRTHDAIVWGTGEEQARRKAEHDPKLKKPITSELGAVTPCIVVPGNWSEEDLKFQARHIAGMVANNGSFNCNACKVIVTSKNWPQRERFLELVDAALAQTPTRKAYYPGAQERYQGFLNHYPNAEPLSERTKDTVPWTILPDINPEKGEYALTNEAFCGVLAQTSLDASDPADFMAKATAFANDDCWGTLSCMVLIHPETQTLYGKSLDAMLAGLRYGGIGVNAWAGVIYGLVVTTWGAFPGHPLEDVQSGRGVVHNALFIDHPQKSIVKAPFRIVPTPAWFADHKTGHLLGPALTRFEANPGLITLASVISAALRG